MERNQLPCWTALSIIGVISLFGVFVWQFPAGSSEWAAWVQAFGSILAVIGSVSVVRYQNQLNIRDAYDALQRQRREQMAGVRKVCEHGWDAVDEFRVCVESGYEDAVRAYVRRLHLDRPFETIQALLDRVPLYDEPYAAVAGEVLSFRRGLLLFQDCLSEYGADLSIRPDLWREMYYSSDLEESAALVESRLAELRGAIDRWGAENFSENLG